MIMLAGCVITDEEGRILLLHRNTPERVQWEVPGGGIEPGEDAVRAAVREVHEELDLVVEPVRVLGSALFTEDHTTMTYTWVLARIVSGQPRVVERHLHDAWAYLGVDKLVRCAGELSPNTRNLVAEIVRGRVDTTIHTASEE